MVMSLLRGCCPKNGDLRETDERVGRPRLLDPHLQGRDGLWREVNLKAFVRIVWELAGHHRCSVAETQFGSRDLHLCAGPVEPAASGPVSAAQSPDAAAVPTTNAIKETDLLTVTSSLVGGLSLPGYGCVRTLFSLRTCGRVSAGRSSSSSASRTALRQGHPRLAPC